jgi:hypothetical protein
VFCLPLVSACSQKNIFTGDYEFRGFWLDIKKGQRPWGLNFAL